MTLCCYSVPSLLVGRRSGVVARIVVHFAKHSLLMPSDSRMSSTVKLVELVAVGLSFAGKYSVVVEAVQKTKRFHQAIQFSSKDGRVLAKM